MSALLLQLISFSTEKFVNATDAERRFLLAGGHLQNEIVILNKLMPWMIRGSGGETIDRNLGALQGMTVARVMAGKLSEGWRLVEVAYFGSKLSAEPALALAAAPADALKILKKYFNGKNIIHLLRNDFAFHYSPQQMAECWQDLQKEEGFDLIVGDTLGNTFHRAAEFAANLAMLNAVQPGDRGAALGRVFADIGEVAKNFNTFVDGVVHAILARLNALEPTGSVELQDLRDFTEVCVPFFTRMPAQDERPALPT